MKSVIEFVTGYGWNSIDSRWEEYGIFSYPFLWAFLFKVCWDEFFDSVRKGYG